MQVDGLEVAEVRENDVIKTDETGVQTKMAELERWARVGLRGGSGNRQDGGPIFKRMMQAIRGLRRPRRRLQIEQIH